MIPEETVGIIGGLTLPKRVIRRLLACLLIIPVMLQGFSFVHADALSMKKIVSVVFDDSGSMADDTMRWSYANYAMQAFCSLLNKEDELYITYMSNFHNPVKIDLAQDVQSNVNKIRSHFAGNDTPIGSVDNAMETLRNIKDDNVNTRYWLIIITDGYFNVTGDPSQQVEVIDLERRVYDFLAEKMPNGVAPQVSYFAIGSSVNKLKTDTNKGLYSYEAEGASEIVRVMSEIADTVSGRMRISDSQINFVDAKTVQVDFQLPILNLAVLTQGSMANVAEVRSTESSLNNVHAASLLYPEEHNGFKTDKSLTGNMAIFNNGFMNSPAGTYTFKFTEPIDQDTLVIMYEPAIEIRTKVFLANGREIVDPKALLDNDTIDVVCNIFESGTDKIIDPDLLSGNVKYSIAYWEEGSLIKEETGTSLTLKNIALKSAPTDLIASISIPGFVPMVNKLSFHPSPALNYAMRVVNPDGDSIVRTNLFQNEKRMVFTIFGDNQPLSRIDLENLSLHFTIAEPYQEILDLETFYNDDGTISLTPKYNKGWDTLWGKDFWNFHVSWPVIGIPIAQFKVTGGIGETIFRELVTGELTIEQENLMQMIWNITAPILILLYIIGLLIKPRFKRGLRVASISVKYDPVSGMGNALTSDTTHWNYKSLNSFSLWWFVPYAAGRQKVDRLVFIAQSGGLINVRKKSLASGSCKLRSNDAENNRRIAIDNSRFRLANNDTDIEALASQSYSLGDALLNIAKPGKVSSIQTGRVFKIVGR